MLYLFFNSKLILADSRVSSWARILHYAHGTFSNMDKIGQFLDDRDKGLKFSSQQNWNGRQRESNPQGLIIKSDSLGKDTYIHEQSQNSQHKRVQVGNL